VCAGNVTANREYAMWFQVLCRAALKGDHCVAKR